MRRTPGSRPSIGSTRRIDTLRPAAAASRPFTPDGADRHPSRAPVAWIETLDRLDAVDRHPSPAHRRIESLHTGRPGSTPFPMRRSLGSRPLTGSTRRIDAPRPPTAGSSPFTPDGPNRHPSRAPDARIETLDRLHLADRHPSAHHCRIETLHNGRRGSTPFLRASRLDRDP